MTRFTGSLALARVALRRDRLQLPIWLLGIGGLMAAIAATWSTYFAADLAAAMRMFVVNPVGRLFGLASGVSTGGYIMTRGFTVFAILAALMSTLAVVRHTRQNEDTRRAELIGSSVVGRHASLMAALIVAVGANILLAVLIALALVVNDLEVSSSLAAGAAVGGVGIAFAGIAAVTAQLSGTSRGANGMAAAGIGLALLLSGVGNMLGSARLDTMEVVSAWPSWLSPIGWGQQLRPFGGDHWWVLGLSGAFFVALTVVAFGLASRRDIGRGLLPERRGPATAAQGLLSPLGLAWRLQQGLFIGWAFGMATLGLVWGALVSDVQGFHDIDEIAEFIQRLGGAAAFQDTVFAFLMSLVGIVIAVYMVQVLVRMRSEESEGPLESVLATAVTRSRWLMGHVATAVLGTTALFLVTGLGTGLAAGLVMGDLERHIRDLTLASLIQAPAAFALGGGIVAAFGLLPRWAGPLSWAAYFIALLTGPVLSAFLDLPQSLRNISPFTHVPMLPGEAATAAPVAALLAIAVTLTAIGLVAFQRRDLASQLG